MTGGMRQPVNWLFGDVETSRAQTARRQLAALMAMLLASAALSGLDSTIGHNGTVRHGDVPVAQISPR